MFVLLTRRTKHLRRPEVKDRSTLPARPRVIGRAKADRAVALQVEPERHERPGQSGYSPRDG